MKLNKVATIAQLNQALSMSALDADNILLVHFDRNKNVWWLDIPFSQLKAGKFPSLLLMSPADDAVERLKVPIGLLRQQQGGLELRDKSACRLTLSLELNVGPGRRLCDAHPGGAGPDFTLFLQSWAETSARQFDAFRVDRSQAFLIETADNLLEGPLVDPEEPVDIFRRIPVAERQATAGLQQSGRDPLAQFDGGLGADRLQAQGDLAVHA